MKPLPVVVVLSLLTSGCPESFEVAKTEEQVLLQCEPSMPLPTPLAASALPVTFPPRESLAPPPKEFIDTSPVVTQRVDAETGTLETPVRLGDSGTLVESPADGSSGGSATYSVSLSESGIYQIWVRSRTSHPDSNAMTVQLDDRSPFTWHPPVSADWMWSRIQAFDQPIPFSALFSNSRAASLKLTWGRAGILVDEIVFTTRLDFAP